jgi:hypothetical protein
MNMKYEIKIEKTQKYENRVNKKLFLIMLIIKSKIKLSFLNYPLSSAAMSASKRSACSLVLPGVTPASWSVFRVVLRMQNISVVLLSPVVGH